MRTIRLLLAAVALCSTSVSAAVLPVEVDIAKDLLERGAAEDAWLLLESEPDAAGTEPESWFVRGLAAKATRRFAEAARAFQRVLELDPGAGRARLELAEVSFANGDVEAARSHLLAVKASNPPARVGENIDRFLEMLNTPERRNWRVYGSLGYMYDSNANAGPGSDSVLMYGLPFTLSRSAMGTSDGATLLRVGVEHAARLGDGIAWQSGASFGHTGYASLRALDTASLSLSSGPSWQASDETAVSMPVVADWLRLGHSDSWYSYSIGVAPQLRRALSKDTAASLTATASRKWYYRRIDRDLHAWSVSPDFEWRFGDKGWLNAALTYGREDSKLESFSNESRSANIGYGREVTELMRFNVNAQYFDTRYREPEAAFSERRHDHTTRLHASIGYRLRQIAGDLTLSLSYTDNRSNLTLYAYDRTQFSVSVGKTF